MPYEPNTVLVNKTYNVIGTRPNRPDGVDKVTGRAVYGDDFKIPGTLYGAILRSPHAHANIKSIDTSKAKAFPGVQAVVTGADMPLTEDEILAMGESAGNLRFLSINALARDKAFYKGHAIAGVAASDPYTAELALSLIDVEYEILPFVIDVREAMKDSAPIIHKGMTTKFFDKDTGKISNIGNIQKYSLGDIEKGFQQADIIIEREFNTKTVHQGYIESHSATALWRSDGTLSLWLSTQGIFDVRSNMARILNIPESMIRVIPTEIGGGFGGKIPVYAEPVAAILSKKTGSPVKITLKRNEVFEATGPAPGSYFKTKIGATKDGKIVAAHAYMVYESGAFPGGPLATAVMGVFAPYKIDNVVIEGLDVVVNKAKTAAYRAPGAPHALFSTETIINELAEQLSIDPIEFRLMNAAKEGDRRGDGIIWARIGCVEVLEAAKAHDHWNSPLANGASGRGLALGFWKNGGGPSACTINVNSDGSVSLIEGNPDIGGTRASIAMQAAETLGIKYEEVHPQVVDTDTIGYTAGTYGSRTTFATGMAAVEAAKDVICKMKIRCSMIWEINQDSIKFENGFFMSKEDPELNFTFSELASLLSSTGGPISGQANVNPNIMPGAFSVHLVDLDVDKETGKVKICRYTAIQDAGKAIHPSYVEGQIQGGVAQGIGWALNEEYIFDDKGGMQNASLLDYRMPTSLDLPMIDTVIVEVTNPDHPFGVRGTGEVPIVPPAPAIANAIFNATGKRYYNLPMKPEVILKAIQSNKQ